MGQGGPLICTSQWVGRGRRVLSAAIMAGSCMDFCTAVIEINGVITVQQLGEWPVLARDSGGNWFWFLGDGCLRGWRVTGTGVGESADLDLGCARSFAAGYADSGALLVLLERPGEARGSRLELLQVVGHDAVPAGVLAAGRGPLFPHFIPPAHAGGRWLPGWREGRSLHLRGTSLELPRPLAELRWLAPSGEERFWPWSFAGVSCDRVPVTGFLGFNGWEPWEAAEDMTLLAPGYLHDPPQIQFLAVLSRGDDHLLVGRRWSDRGVTAGRFNWSGPSTVVLPGSGEGGFGGVISCPESPDFFWAPRGRGTFSGDLERPSERIIREVLPLEAGDAHLPSMPVRLRGASCPVGGGQRVCHSAGWGVMMPNFLPLSLPPGCPLAAKSPEGGGEERQPPEGSRRSSAVRLRTALSAALIEVESLRKERDELRRKLDRFDRRDPERFPEHDMRGQ